tara:strand:+ start:1758 stop:1931 length:174 start_codon:yes stop_codon:yes gene_type:complete
MLGKLELDESISMLKELEKKIPSNLYNLSSSHERDLNLILRIIKSLDVPERLGNLND